MKKDEISESANKHLSYETHPCRLSRWMAWKRHIEIYRCDLSRFTPTGLGRTLSRCRVAFCSGHTQISKYANALVHYCRVFLDDFQSDFPRRQFYCSHVITSIVGIYLIKISFLFIKDGRNLEWWLFRIQGNRKIEFIIGSN